MNTRHARPGMCGNWVSHWSPAECLDQAASGLQSTADLELRVEDYMLLDAMCQRRKSWSCEHCRNGVEFKNPATCRTCLWASPQRYEHIAMEQRRQLTLNWAGDDVEKYEQLRAQTEAIGISMEDYVKAQLT